MSNAETQKDAWPDRYGILMDVMDRESKKGPYVTFKAQGKGFDFYGACFDAETIKQMKAAVGKRVWMKGPLESRTVDGVERKSFKVIFFSVSEAKDDAKTAEAETATA